AMKRHRFLPTNAMLALALLATLATTGFAQEETRTWVDSSGQHRTEATLIKVDGDNVELRTTDGRTISVDIDKLSRADQEYLALRQPAKDDEAAPGTRRRTLPPARKPETDEFGEVQIQTGDAVEIRMPRSATWSLTPDVRAPNSLQLTNDPIEITDSETIKAGGGAVATPDGKHAIISFMIDPRERFDLDDFDMEHSRLMLLDLVTGEILGTSKFRSEGDGVHDVTPDGLRMMTGTTGWGHLNGHPRIFEIRNGQVREKIKFNPHPQRKTVVKFARFADDERMVTWNSVGTIAVWDYDYAKLLWWLDSNSGNILPGISANGKYLVGWARGELFVVDLHEGAVVAKQQAEPNGIKALAISPDGTKFAGVGFNLLRVWDFATGDVLDEMHVGNLITDPMLEWIDNQYVVAQSMNYCEVIDTRLGIPVWNFARGMGGSYFADHQGRLWSWNPDASKRLHPLTVPPPEIADRLRDQDPDDLVVMRSGDSVKVEFFFERYDNRVRDQIEQSVRQKLEESGYNVTSRADKTIRVWAGSGKAFEDEDGRRGWKSDLKMPGFRTSDSHFFQIALYDEDEELVWKGGAAEQPQDDPVPGRYFAHMYIPTTIRQYSTMTITPAELPEAWNNPGSSRMGGGRAFGQRRGGFGGSRRPDRKK
ncbi:MAG: SHD1 domain-containing protein, partial [Pirellulaceae bacterium]